MKTDNLKSGRVNPELVWGFSVGIVYAGKFPMDDGVHLCGFEQRLINVHIGPLVLHCWLPEK